MPVPDLEAAADRLRDEQGLDSVQGGRHEAFGTANRIVPLDGPYLEVVAVVDPTLAASTAFGSWVAAAAARGGLAAYAVSTPDVAAVGERLGFPVSPGARRRTDGSVLRWRLAGLERAIDEPSLPFFLQWDIPEQSHPGKDPAQHRVTVEAVELEVSGNAERLGEWLGTDPAALGIRVVEGPPGVRSLVVRTADGTLTVG